MSRLSWSSRWMSFGTGAVAVALVAAGCAKKEAEPAAQAGPNHVFVTAADYAFTAPDTVAAGLEMFHLVNKGPSVHHLQIVKLRENKTTADLAAAFKNPGPPPAWVQWVGGANAVAPSGVDTSVAYLTLAPGNYALICVIPDSAGVPHFAHGMLRALTVTASALTPALEPRADAVIHLKDYAFAVMGTIAAGQRNIRVVNDGPQVHEMVIVALAPGKTAKDLLAWVDGGMKGMPPGKPLGGAAGLAPGGHETVSVMLPAGNYALICFWPDAKDGKEHAQHGMVMDLKVS
jgi:hypothetical protein